MPLPLFLVASSISMLNFPMFPVPTEQPGHVDDSRPRNALGQAAQAANNCDYRTLQLPHRLGILPRVTDES